MEGQMMEGQTPLGRDQGIDDLKIDLNKRPIEHQI